MGIATGNAGWIQQPLLLGLPRRWIDTTRIVPIESVATVTASEIENASENACVVHEQLRVKANTLLEGHHIADITPLVTNTSEAWIETVNASVSARGEGVTESANAKEEHSSSISNLSFLDDFLIRKLGHTFAILLTIQSRKLTQAIALYFCYCTIYY